LTYWKLTALSICKVAYGNMNKKKWNKDGA